jgi:flagellar protein FliS
MVRGASPVRLVICLYEQAIEDLRRALVALEKNDIETRTREINHALTVIGQLQGTLDREHGGEVARNLEAFYNLIRAGLMEAQIKQSPKILQQQISQLTMVYEAWLEVDRITQGAPTQASGPASAAPLLPSPETPLADWNA